MSRLSRHRRQILLYVAVATLLQNALLSDCFNLQINEDVISNSGIKMHNANNLKSGGTDHFKVRRAIGHRQAKTVMKVLPADESLLRDFSSEEVAEKMAKVRIQRHPRLQPLPVKKRFQKGKRSQADTTRSDTSPVEKNTLKESHFNKILDILQRSEGYFLEQLLSLRDAIEGTSQLLQENKISKQNDAIKDILYQSVSSYGT